jgi:hypothetical protein
MNVMVVLAVVSVVGAAALFVALALFLRAIDGELETIGGPATRFVAPANYLAKIRLGVRAIERQTDALAAPTHDGVPTPSRAQYTVRARRAAVPARRARRRSRRS